MWLDTQDSRSWDQNQAHCYIYIYIYYEALEKSGFKQRLECLESLKDNYVTNNKEKNDSNNINDNNNNNSNNNSA